MRVVLKKNRIPTALRLCFPFVGGIRILLSSASLPCVSGAAAAALALTYVHKNAPVSCWRLFFQPAEVTAHLSEWV